MSETKIMIVVHQQMGRISFSFVTLMNFLGFFGWRSFSSHCGRTWKMDLSKLSQTTTPKCRKVTKQIAVWIDYVCVCACSHLFMCLHLKRIQKTPKIIVMWNEMTVRIKPFYDYFFNDSRVFFVQQIISLLLFALHSAWLTKEYARTHTHTLCQTSYFVHIFTLRFKWTSFMFGLSFFLSFWLNLDECSLLDPMCHSLVAK